MDAEQIAELRTAMHTRDLTCIELHNILDAAEESEKWRSDYCNNRIMQTAMENSKAIMETETVKAMQQEIRSLRQTIEALESNAKLFDEVAAEADQKLREGEKKATPRPRGTDTIRAILVELNRQVEGMILDLAESQERERQGEYVGRER